MTVTPLGRHTSWPLQVVAACGSQLDQTYLIFTSDHGFTLGEFGMLMDKVREALLLSTADRYTSSECSWKEALLTC